ncbi:hypothetical protein JL722_9937 [Aureococcus anophagefferens]|nr:hypothetical protein JL722_9937 [Aureococcus anophagefferens]
MLSGYLQKRGKLRQNWKRRYFALKGHTLSCYADARPGRGVLCAINLNKLDACGPDDGGDDDGVFSLSVPQGAIKLRAASAADRDAWVSAIALPPPPPTATPGKFRDAAPPPPPTSTPGKFRVAVASPDALLAAARRRAAAGAAGPADPAYAPSFATVAAAQGGADMASEALATVVRDHDADDDDELTVSAGDVVSVKLARGAWAYCEENDGWVLVQKGADQGLVPFDCLKPGVETSADLGRGGAQHWIEQVTGTVFSRRFGDELRDGVLLVDLAAAIAPGDDIKPPYEGRVPYRRVENIARFLAFCRDRGVAGADLFDTVDLAELKDLGAVVRCLVALSAALRKAGAFAGPFLATSRDALASAAALVAEAADYRVAMLGLRDAGADVRGVDRDDLEDAFLVLYSSSTKATARAEAHERRVVNLLEAKRKRYEMVYVDVSPERRGALDAAAPGAPLPAPRRARTSATTTLQELEDDGKLDGKLAPARDGAGFWRCPTPGARRAPSRTAAASRSERGPGRWVLGTLARV